MLWGNAGYADVKPALGQWEQERLDSSVLTKILRNILHLFFLPSFFFDFQSETGTQGDRDPSRVWLETQEPRSPGSWRFSLAPELCPPGPTQDTGAKSNLQNNETPSLGRRFWSFICTGGSWDIHGSGKS